MVNKCELSVNRRHLRQAKDADRLGPEWRAIGTGTQAFPVVDKRSPADREDLTHSGRQAEHGKVRHEVMKTTVACRMTTQPGILLSVFYLDAHRW
jgi:hypothetical protein